MEGQYHESQINKKGPRPRFLDDFRASITYLVDFISSKNNRIAIWRSTLPQHFDTFDGHYEKGNNKCSLKQRPLQRYKNETNYAFSTFCNNTQSKYEHDCTVNVTRLDKT
eukprot:134589_1